MIIDNIIKEMKNENIPVDIKREDILETVNNIPYKPNKYYVSRNPKVIKNYLLIKE